MRDTLKALLNKPARVLGIDPGLSGACAVVGQGGFTVRRDFKTLRDISRAVSYLIETYSPTHIVIEQVSSRPGQGVCSVWSFGKSTGVAIGSLYVAAPDQTVEESHPLRWQNYFRKQLGIKRPKEFDSRQIMLDHFPELQVYFKRKKDHASGDASLIALWKLAHL